MKVFRDKQKGTETHSGCDASQEIQSGGDWIRHSYCPLSPSDHCD